MHRSANSRPAIATLQVVRAVEDHLVHSHPRANGAVDWVPAWSRPLASLASGAGMTHGAIFVVATNPVLPPLDPGYGGS
jgi:hypothetical protein